MIPAREIVDRLRNRYPLGDGWITMAEVTPPKCARRFDLLAVIGWQSRGHEAQGFEVKVSRGDWLAELKDPAKAEPLVRLCSRYWIVAPPGVVAKDEVPPAWGLLVVHPEVIRAERQAKRLDCAPWDEAMWRCMLLRCATRESRTPDDIAAARNAGRKEGFSDGVTQGEREAASAVKRVEQLEEVIRRAHEATGVSLGQWTDFAALGEAMQVIRSARAGDRNHLARLEREAEHFRDIAAQLDRAVAALTSKAEGVPV